MQLHENPAAFLALSPVPLAMSVAGLALFIICVFTLKKDVLQSRGIGRIVALTPLCFAVSLAVFSGAHLAREKSLLDIVPDYMPWPLFWLYLVGFALIAAALSIATGILVRWSGLLLGVMMLLFVAMLFLPGAFASGGRFAWTVVFRESSFGGAGWVLAGVAMGGARSVPGSRLITIGRVLIALAAIFFGVQHFLHPLGLPVVPLQRTTPTWVPARAAIDYLTGAFLVVAGLCFLLSRYTHVAAAYLGGWIVLLVLTIYVPVMIGALVNPVADAQIEGLNYFADTLLFGGVILSLARTGMPAQ